MDVPWNLLLLPLLGGYIFVRFWNFSRINILRSDKDRILIRSALAGLGFSFVAFAIAIFTPRAWICSVDGWCLDTWWSANTPGEFSGTAFIAFWIGAFGWIPANLFYSKRQSMDRAIQEDGDPLELLLKRAKDESEAVAITLLSEKVYIGLITHEFSASRTLSNIAFIPLHSGYRDSVSKRFILTTNYAELLHEWTERLDELDVEIRKYRSKRPKIEKLHGKAEVVEADEAIQKLIGEWEALERRVELFEVVIPVAQVASAFLWDEEIYLENFVPPRQSEPD